MTDRSEEPLQVSQNSCPVTLKRNDSLVPALFSLPRLIVREAIEQAGLELVERSESFGHWNGALRYRCLRSDNFERPNFQQRVFSRISGKDPLAQTKIDSAFVGPLGFTGQLQLPIPGAFRPGVTGRNMAGGLATVLPHKLRRRPNQISKVTYRFDKYLADATKWDPIIAAFQDYL